MRVRQLELHRALGVIGEPSSGAAPLVPSVSQPLLAHTAVTDPAHTRIRVAILIDSDMHSRRVLKELLPRSAP